MKLPILGYFDLHNRELHGTQQVSAAFFLLQSYVRGSRRPQVDGNRAANTHGNLPPTNERQMCTIHFLNPSQTLSLTTRDSRALRQPPVPTPPRGRERRPGESGGRKGALCVRPRPQPNSQNSAAIAQSPTAKMAAGAESARPPRGGTAATARG